MTEIGETARELTGQCVEVEEELWRDLGDLVLFEHAGE